MRKATQLTTVCLLAAISFFVTGCAFSRVTADTTSPLYDPKTGPRFDKRLVGTWLPESICIDLRKGPDNAYLAKSGLFGGLPAPSGEHSVAEPIHLVKIGKYEYFFAAPKPNERGTLLTNCCRVEFCNEKIFLSALNLQTITDDLEKHPELLKHEWHPETQPSGVAVEEPTTQPATMPTTQPGTQPAIMPATSTATAPDEPCRRNGHLQITDSPEAIREYLIRHEDDPEFFGDPAIFLRVAK